MSLWVPPKVTAELLEERRRREAVTLNALRAENEWEQVKHWNKELARVEPNLKLVYCPDPAPVDAAAAGAKPGRWHIVRFNPGSPINFILLETPEGDYAEPGSWMFDLLRKSDLWNAQVQRERESLRRRAEDAKRRAEANFRQARDEEMADAIRAHTRTQISMNRSTPWSQNATGARAAKAHAKSRRKAA